GKLVAAKPGESGILLAKIGRMAEFEGYVDKSKNASKVLDDPFGDGARYFNTGDLLTLHADNWVSFADRLGDTFRWKGENVSTNDVQEQVSRAPGVLEAVAYGVEIPGADGRAGMVAIRVDERFDPAKLREHIDATLPFYARPLFVRVRSDRLGDTFRWKGENVSTNDVQEQVSRAPGVLEAVAYGVEIPGADGRAGMVAIRVDERFDPAKLREHIDATLPFYARPLFVRV